MAKKIKCDCDITFEVEEGQTHCNYCGMKLSDIGKKKPAKLAKEGKTTLSEAQKKKIEEEEKYRASVRKDLEEKKKGRGCLIAIGLLVGFFILIAAVSDGGEKEKPKPTPLPVKQEETEATPKVTPEEAARIAEYSLKASVYSTDLTNFWNTRAELGEKWPNWTDDDVVKFAAAGIGIENTYDLFKELTPPKTLDSAHQKLLKGLELWKRSVAIANEGIDNFDADLIKQATALMEEGNKWVNEATKEIEEITEELQTP